MTAIIHSTMRLLTTTYHGKMIVNTDSRPSRSFERWEDLLRSVGISLVCIRVI